MKIDFKDIAIFAKIVSSGLLIAGFILLGYYVGLRLQERYCLSGVISLLGALIGAAFGLQQCWAMIKSVIDQVKKSK